MARDPQMSRALATQKQAPIRRRAQAIIKARPDIAAITVYDDSGRRITYVKRAPALAPGALACSWMRPAPPGPGHCSVCTPRLSRAKRST